MYIIFAAKSFRVHGKVRATQRSFIPLSLPFVVAAQIQEISEYIDGSDEKKWVEKGARGGRAACVLSMMAVIAYAGYTLTYIIKSAPNALKNETLSFIHF